MRESFHFMITKMVSNNARREEKAQVTEKVESGGVLNRQRKKWEVNIDMHPENSVEQQPPHNQRPNTRVGRSAQPGQINRMEIYKFCREQLKNDSKDSRRRRVSWVRRFDTLGSPGEKETVSSQCIGERKADLT